MLHLPPEVESGGKTAPGLDELVVAVSMVSAKGEDVAEAVGLDGGEGVVDLVDGHIGAGQVHHRLHAHHVLHCVGDLKGELRR